MSATQTPHPALGKFPVWLVTIDTPKGQAEVEAPASTADLAWKRVWLLALGQGWGDVDEVTLVSVEEVQP
jgi:hypothetical protein